MPVAKNFLFVGGTLERITTPDLEEGLGRRDGQSMLLRAIASVLNLLQFQLPQGAENPFVLNGQRADYLVICLA